MTSSETEIGVASELAVAKPLTSLDHVDLTNCDIEPIHKLGAIQSFGFLVVAASDWMVSRASVNLHLFLGVAHADAIGRPITALLCPEAIHTLRNRFTLIRSRDMVERIFGVALQDGGPLFDVAVHVSAGQFVIEAEPSRKQVASETSLSIRGMMVRLDKPKLMPAFYKEGARQIQAMTGFDRVMVYRFDETGSGEVVAEAVRPGIGSFLGLHYPSSDIPVQARALYLRNLFRIIADVNDVAVAVMPMVDETGDALDLSMSVLRSSSPIHIEYLKNMGVEASLSISILVDGKLWGLFACHHYTPRLPTFERRSTAELFGQMFASRLESREHRSALEYETRTREIADRLLTSVADNASLLEEPDWLSNAISDVIPADGIGVWIDGRAALSGLAPSLEQFREIVQALDRTAAGRVFSTDHLLSFIPTLKTGGVFSGLLAIPISRIPRDYVVLFRQEIIKTVRWAGDPHKPVTYGENGPRLTPRKSFEIWSELVRDHSLAFTPAERRVAETIRSTLIEVILRLSDETNALRQKASDRQEILIAELNHRVRNILGLIGGLVRQSKSSAVSVETYAHQLEGRIQSLARAHDQITRDQWKSASLRGLLQAEAAAYLGATADRVALHGSDVLLSPHAFSTVALVFHELMTNSAKYGSLSTVGIVDVSWQRQSNGALSIFWRESGGPVVDVPTRQGFGTTIIHRSIPFDLKGEAEITFSPAGVQATFLVPANFVTLSPHPQKDDAPPIVVPAKNSSLAPGDKVLAARTVLLVEDNLIIAMDGEDILLQLGAATVVTVTSVAQGLDEIDRTRFDFAILDVNLGHETSFPIADRLAALNVPFLFATGYSDMTDRFKDYPAAEILQKPYSPESIGRAVEAIFSRIRPAILPLS